MECTCVESNGLECPSHEPCDECGSTACEGTHIVRDDPGAIVDIHGVPMTPETGKVMLDRVQRDLDFLPGQSDLQIDAPDVRRMLKLARRGLESQAKAEKWDRLDRCESCGFLCEPGEDESYDCHFCNWESEQRKKLAESQARIDEIGRAAGKEIGKMGAKLGYAEARIEALEARLHEIIASTGYSYSAATFQVEDMKEIANKALLGEEGR